MFETSLLRRRTLGEFFAPALPILKYLVLRTETHAYCAALAFFALLGFYPFCSLLLWIARYVLQSNEAENVIEQTLRTYYPEAPDFLLRNLSVSVERHGAGWPLSSIFWVLLGAAGIFIPLEMAFNHVFGAREHRPYWRNQAVGFVLTSLCCVLALLFVLSTAALHRELLESSGSAVLRATGPIVLRLLALGFSVMVIFVFYKFLPNVSVPTGPVLLAAIAAGVVVEVLRTAFQAALPFAHLQSQHGPFYVSASFVLLVYFETFVVLGGAYLAAGGENIPDENAA